ncbi:arsenate reductase (glutaredoxin) [Sphingomonas jatrophae]|uniref:Arsenate reductase n=1 Tax=Sphingomonas jatrophae TaxID=1166337 RepID=A0A1I6K962_9SPHN|nr:arsenate reductase (glutaredoxin) [Sphingomonas jatrophae]SFR87803.1 arsenate reductase [Sphingomonas jatrophae]
MKATIWHNPRCSKSRETLALLEAAGAEIATVEYLKAPPERAELERLLAKGGLAPRDVLRAGEPLAKELALADADDDRLLSLMLLHPVLIERPLVETDKGVRLGRPPERVREIL